MPYTPETTIENKNTLKRRLIKAGVSVLAVAALAGCGENDATGNTPPSQGVETSAPAETEQNPAEAIENKIINRETISEDEYNELLSIMPEAPELTPAIESGIENNQAILTESLIVTDATQETQLSQQSAAMMSAAGEFFTQFPQALSEVKVPAELATDEAFTEEARRIYGLQEAITARQGNIAYDTFISEYIPENGYIDINAKEKLLIDYTNKSLEALPIANTEENKLWVSTGYGLMSSFEAQLDGMEPTYKFDLEIDPASAYPTPGGMGNENTYRIDANARLFTVDREMPRYMDLVLNITSREDGKGQVTNILTDAN